jgi:hypothetical protein
MYGLGGEDGNADVRVKGLCDTGRGFPGWRDPRDVETGGAHAAGAFGQAGVRE